jgi:hypothetical protein
MYDNVIRASQNKIIFCSIHVFVHASGLTLGDEPNMCVLTSENDGLNEKKME